MNRQPAPVMWQAALLPSLPSFEAKAHRTPRLQFSKKFSFSTCQVPPNQPPQVAGYENGDDNDLPVTMDWPRANSASGSLV